MAISGDELHAITRPLNVSRRIGIRLRLRVSRGWCEIHLRGDAERRQAEHDDDRQSSLLHDHSPLESAYQRRSGYLQPRRNPSGIIVVWLSYFT